MNTKTPSKKSTNVVLSAPGMQWGYAKKLIDAFEEIVSADQIKNCDMKLSKFQIIV